MAPEKYDNLSNGFKDVFDEINELITHPLVTINDEEFKFKFYICSDYKVCSYIASYNYY